MGNSCQVPPLAPCFGNSLFNHWRVGEKKWFPPVVKKKPCPWFRQKRDRDFSSELKVRSGGPACRWWHRYTGIHSLTSGWWLRKNCLRQLWQKIKKKRDRDFSYELKVRSGLTSVQVVTSLKMPGSNWAGRLEKLWNLQQDHLFECPRKRTFSVGFPFCWEASREVLMLGCNSLVFYNCCSVIAAIDFLDYNFFRNARNRWIIYQNACYRFGLTRVWQDSTWGQNWFWLKGLFLS